MGGEGAGADEIIETFFVLVSTGGDGVNIGGADGFVGFLGGGVFGFEVADMEVLFTVFGLYVFCHGGDGLIGEIEGVGTVIGDETGLIEALGGAHGGGGGETEAGVGLDLEGGGGEGDGIGFGAFGFIDAGNGVFNLG